MTQKILITDNYIDEMTHELLRGMEIKKQHWATDKDEIELFEKTRVSFVNALKTCYTLSFPYGQGGN